MTIRALDIGSFGTNLAFESSAPTDFACRWYDEVAPTEG
jgi:hypothetical protein